MWVMLQHDAVSSRDSESRSDAVDGADATSILIVPANALQTYRAHPVLRACTKAISSAEDESFCQDCLEGMLDALACPVVVRPGDVLIYRGDIWHRTQDTSHRRLALSLKLQRNLTVR
jgi:ectoine hydroxylase-related dioxygenase (phytanoyl-CoA dioxygenase family)